MTMWGLTWGHRLIGVSPIAKLVAMRIGDSADAEGHGNIDIDDLAEWCCATEDEVWVALEQLETAGVKWSAEGNRIEFEVPPQALPTPRRPSVIEKTLTLYVISGARGTKIGITSDLDRRLAGLRVSMVEDGIKAEWSTRGPATLIRRAERVAHQALAAHVIRSEWFSITVAEGVAAAEAALAAVRGWK